MASVPANDSRLAYMGRVAFVGDEARMGYPGVTFRFVYRGPAPVLRFTAGSPNCYFNLAVNGWDPVVIHLKEGANEVALPSGAAPADGWLVELTRRTESWQGVVAFAGLSLPPGCALVPPPPWPERKLLFIGDSITGGEYVELFPPVWPGDATPRAANAARSYGALLGRQLKAQVQLVSCGGRGLVRDWQGKTDGINAPQFFELALPDDPAIRWDHAQYQPDAIVICLGQNDFSSGLPDETEYTAAYAAFIARIRAVHPRAALVLAGSPIQKETPDSADRAKRDQLRRTLDAVVAQRHAAGDNRIASVSLRYQPGTPANGHPVAFQHEQIAAEIIGPLQQLTGW